MLLFVLMLIGVPVVEVFAFIEVGRASGWLLAVILLLATSVLGSLLLRIQGRAAIAGVSRAVSEHRAPGRAAIEGALGFLGCLLLVIPGFVTDALGLLLLFGPTRRLLRAAISRRYAGRMMGFLAATERFAPGGRRSEPADVDSTVVDDDRGQLDR